MRKKDVKYKTNSKIQDYTPTVNERQQIKKQTSRVGSKAKGNNVLSTRNPI